MIPELYVLIMLSKSISDHIMNLHYENSDFAWTFRIAFNKHSR